MKASRFVATDPAEFQFGTPAAEHFCGGKGGKPGPCPTGRQEQSGGSGAAASAAPAPAAPSPPAQSPQNPSPAVSAAQPAAAAKSSPLGRTVKSAGRWLAAKWQKLEQRYGRKGALLMAVGMAATFPIPGNITAIIGAAEAIRGIHGFLAHRQGLAMQCEKLCERRQSQAFREWQPRVGEHLTKMCGGKGGKPGPCGKGQTKSKGEPSAPKEPREYEHVDPSELPWSGDLPVPADWRSLTSDPGRLGPVKILDIGDLRPSEESSRFDVDALKEHIKNPDNDLPPPVVERDTDGLYIVDGNTRLQAAKELGYKKIPVREHLSSDHSGVSATPSAVSAQKRMAGRPPEMQDMLKRLTAPEGGFTYQPLTHESPTKGFALSVYPERSWAKDAKDVTLDDLKAYADKNKDLLADPHAYLGGWHDPESGKVFLDISLVNEDPKTALKDCIEHDQLAMFDLEKKVSVPCKENATSGGLVNVHADGGSLPSFGMVRPTADGLQTLFGYVRAAADLLGGGDDEAADFAEWKLRVRKYLDKKFPKP